MSEIQELPSGVGNQYRFRPVGSREVHGMVNKVREELYDARLLAVRHFLRQFRKNPDRVGNFALTDFRLSRFNEDTDNPVIEPTIGSLILRGSLAESRLGAFFTPDRVFRREDNDVELRGPNYYINLDPNKRKVPAKLSVIGKDFRDGVSAIDQVGRPQNEKELLMYLGVLDYLKIHSLSLLHAVTYDERVAQIPDDLEERTKYLTMRREAVDLATIATRRFYQAALGLPFDEEGVEGIKEEFEDVFNYVQDTTHDGGWRRFTYPDINNPITIMLGAHEAALQNPDIQTIVGLASGGTESAIAAQLFYEKLYERSPNLAILPISFHSHQKQRLELDNAAAMIDQIYPGKFSDRAVLLVDDNSSSGRTLSTADALVRQLGAIDTQAHIAQHDPDRVMDRVVPEVKGKPRGKERDRIKQRQQYLFRMDHSGFRTTMGIVPERSADRDELLIEVKRRLGIQT